LALISLHDRFRLLTWLRSNVAMNAFALCYLDTALWNHTMWLGASIDGELRAIAMIYFGAGGTFVNVMGEEPARKDLLAQADDLLPRTFHMSLEANPDAPITIEGRTLEHVENFYRMIPAAKSPGPAPSDNIVKLAPSDVDRVRELLVNRGANPSAWFQEHTMASGLYRGWLASGELVGVVGLHAWSDEQKIAVVGNLAVIPSMRRTGIARALMESILVELRGRGWEVAFNVRTDNHPALALYGQMGCRAVGIVGEYRVS
jgi:ribosomal protein S18 acetylase RimI-like enzyme